MNIGIMALFAVEGRDGMGGLGYGLGGFSLLLGRAVGAGFEGM